MLFRSKNIFVYMHYIADNICSALVEARRYRCTVCVPEHIYAAVSLYVPDVCMLIDCVAFCVASCVVYLRVLCLMYADRLSRSVTALWLLFLSMTLSVMCASVAVFGCQMCHE